MTTMPGMKKSLVRKNPRLILPKCLWTKLKKFVRNVKSLKRNSGKRRKKRPKNLKKRIEVKKKKRVRFDRMMKKTKRNEIIARNRDPDRDRVIEVIVKIKVELVIVTIVVTEIEIVTETEIAIAEIAITIITIDEIVTAADRTEVAVTIMIDVIEIVIMIDVIEIVIMIDVTEIAIMIDAIFVSPSFSHPETEEVTENVTEIVIAIAIPEVTKDDRGLDQGVQEVAKIHSEDLVQKLTKPSYWQLPNETRLNCLVRII